VIRRVHRGEDSEKKDVFVEGRLLRQRALGSDALYRIIERVERGIRVEVVEAPGLAPGARFVFTEEAVAAMESLYAETDRGYQPAPPATAQRRLV
jgi:hypothetical protein